MTTTADTITFHDPDRDDDGVVIVRYDDDCVWVCLSLKSDGDIEVTMRKEDAKRLAKALDAALR